MEVHTKGKLFVGSGEFAQFSIVPAEATNTKEKQWYIKGIASTGSKDLDGERVNVQGLDISYFKQYGFINFDHKQSPRDIVGEPISNECYIDQDGLHVTALLYKDKPIVQEMWDLSKAMEGAESSRQLGFSIEGYITDRDPDNSSIITGIKVKNVAITTHPANPEATWETFEKSFDKDYTEGHPTDPEALGGNEGTLSVSNLASSLASLTACMRRDNGQQLLKDAEQELLNRGELDFDTKCLLLQVGVGINREQAQKFINEESNNG